MTGMLQAQQAQQAQQARQARCGGVFERSMVECGNESREGGIVSVEECGGGWRTKTSKR